MSLLDHVDVVTAVSHSHRQVRRLLLDPSHDLLFIFRSASVANGRVQGNIGRNALLSIEHEYFGLFVTGYVEEVSSPLLVMVLVVLRNVDSCKPLVD